MIQVHGLAQPASAQKTRHVHTRTHPRRPLSRKSTADLNEAHSSITPPPTPPDRCPTAAVWRAITRPPHCRRYTAPPARRVTGCASSVEQSQRSAKAVLSSSNLLSRIPYRTHASPHDLTCTSSFLSSSMSTAIG